MISEMYSNFLTSQDPHQGTEEEAHGRKWVILKEIHHGYFLACEISDTMPALVQLIYIEKYDRRNPKIP